MGILKFFKSITSSDKKSFDCDRVQSLLSLHADGMASSAERRAIDEHLSDCDICRQQHECLRAIRNVVASRPVAVPPVDLRMRIADAIAAQRRPAPVYARYGPSFGLAGAALIAITAIVLSPLWRSQVASVPHPTPHLRVATEKVPAPVMKLESSSSAAKHSEPLIAENPIETYTAPSVRERIPSGPGLADYRPSASGVSSRDADLASKDTHTTMLAERPKQPAVLVKRQPGTLLATNIPNVHALPSTPGVQSPAGPGVTQTTSQGPSSPVTPPAASVQTAQVPSTAPAAPASPIRVAANVTDSSRPADPLQGIKDHLGQFNGDDGSPYYHNALKYVRVGSGTVTMVGSTW